MKKTLLLFASTVVFAHTNKSGIVSSNETRSLQGSPYTLTRTVQVADGSTFDDSSETFLQRRNFHRWRFEHAFEFRCGECQCGFVQKITL